MPKKTQNNDLQITTQKTIDLAPWTPQKLGLSSDALEEVRRVWRYQSSYQNPIIEEGQTTQWPKEKGQKDKQRSTKHTHIAKDHVQRTPLKSGVNSGAPEW